MLRTAGFSLFELVAGLAVAATVAGSATLALPPVIAKVRLAAAAHRLAATLRQARGRALARNLRIDVRFDVVRGTWDVQEVGGVALETQALPAGVAFGSLPSSARVRFDTTGGAENATIVLNAATSVRRIVVNQRGRVRLQ
jgi:Tfp pilus assembly protein FimT